MELLVFAVLLITDAEVGICLKLPATYIWCGASSRTQVAVIPALAVLGAGDPDVVGCNGGSIAKLASSTGTDKIFPVPPPPVAVVAVAVAEGTFANSRIEKVLDSKVFCCPVVTTGVSASKSPKTAICPNSAKSTGGGTVV